MYDQDVLPVEFMSLVLTRMPGESYRRRLRSLLFCLCDVFRTPINSLGCWSCTINLAPPRSKSLLKGTDSDKVLCVLCVLMFMYYLTVCYSCSCIIILCVTHVHVLLYCVLFYLYLLCSRKANFYVIHRQYQFCILTCQRKPAVKEWFRVPSARTDWLIGSVSQRLATP